MKLIPAQLVRSSQGAEAGPGPSAGATFDQAGVPVRSAAYCNV